MSVQSITSRPISVGYPGSAELELRIEAGECRLEMSPVAGEDWITGTYVDVTGEIPLEITEHEGRVTVRTRHPVPDLGTAPAPILDLRLGTSRPFALTIAAGASTDRLELGGVPIVRLEIKHGAGRLDLDFSRRNPQRLSALKLDIGAGDVEMRRLGNANFDSLAVHGGAGQYVLDFNGQMTRPAQVRLSPAMASVELRLPRSLAAEVISTSHVVSTDADSGFVRRSGSFRTVAADSGEPVMLTVRSSVVLGSLKLVTV